MKKKAFCVSLLALVIVLLVSRIILTGTAQAGPSDTLKVVYNTLVNSRTYRSTQAVYHDSGSSFEAMLEDNNITFTKTGENDVPITWVFVQNGDWLTAPYGSEEESSRGCASMLLAAAVSAQGMNEDLFFGYINALTDLQSKYYEESETENRVSVNIVGPYAIEMDVHSTHVPAGSFTRIQEVQHARADNLGRWCSAEEIALLHRIIDAIPEADTVTHNDLHPGNIMIQEGELVLIDMPEVTMGPPICDLVSIFRDMVAAPRMQSSAMEQSAGMPAELILKAGNLFFQKYTGITDSAELEAYYKKLGLLNAFNVALVPGSGSERAMRMGDAIMNNLFRPIVVPNEQAIRNLLQTM